MAVIDELIVKLVGDTAEYTRSMTAAMILTQQVGTSLEAAVSGIARSLTSQLAPSAATLQVQVDNLTQKLALQADTFGMTARQAALHKLVLEGATDIQLRAARAADALITQLQVEAAAAQAAAKAEEQLAQARTRTFQQAEKANMDNLVAEHRARQEATNAGLKEQQRIERELLALRQRAEQRGDRTGREEKGLLARGEELSARGAAKELANMHKTAADNEAAHMAALQARVKAEADTAAKIREIRENNEAARLRSAERTNQAEARRIQQRIEQETKAVLAAARAREAQEGRDRESRTGQGQTVLQQAFDFSVETARSAIEAFSDFNLALTQSTAIMKITGEEVEQMSQSALALSHNFAFSSTEIAKGFYYLASAGMNAQQVMESMPSILQFASAGMMSVASAANYAIAATSALGLASKDAAIQQLNMTHVMDLVTRASKIALGTTEQYAKALTRDAATSMRTYNISLTEGIALLTAYHNAGIQGAMAGNMMGRAIRLIFASTVTSGQQHRNLGFQVFDPATGLRRQMPDIIKNLKSVLDDYEEEAKPLILKKLGFETLAQKSILPLLDQSDTLAENMKKLRGAGGTIEEISIKQMEAFANQMELIINSVREAAIALGKELVPAAMTLGRIIQGLADAWNNLNPTVRSGVVVILEYATAFGGMILALSTAPMIMAGFTNALSFLSAHPILAATAAMAALVAITFQAISYFSGLRDEITALNLAMKDQSEINAKLHGARATAGDDAIERAARESNISERKRILQESIKRFELEKKALDERKKARQDELAGIGKFQYVREGLASVLGFGPSDNELTKLALDDITAHAKITEGVIKKLKEALEKVFDIKPKKRTIEVEIQDELEKVLKQAQYEGLSPEQQKAREFAKRGGNVGMLDQANVLLEARKREVELNKEFSKVMEDSSNKVAAHKASIGDTAREVQFYDLVLRGATQAQLFMTKSIFEELDAFEKKEALLKRATQVTKENLTPEQKYAEAQAELTKMLGTVDPATGKAIITQETYNRAIAKAAKELTGAKNAAQGFTAALFGSAEAISRLQAQADSLAPIILPSVAGAGGGGTPEKTPKYNIPNQNINNAVLGAVGLGALGAGAQKNEQLDKIAALLEKIHGVLDKGKVIGYLDEDDF